MDTELQKAIEETSISTKLFERVRSEAEKWYRTLPCVKCPYLNDEIKFNVKGLDHIKSKDWNKSRSRKDQYARLKFIKLVPKILETTTTLQGYKVDEFYVRKKNWGSWGDVLNKVYYYEFIHVHKEKVRLKIIVRKDGEGDYYFYSIIPFWKMDALKRRVLTDGDPEKD